MPVSLRGFLLCFVPLCVAFVPVLYYAGLIASIEPVSSLILHICRIGFERISVLLGIHVVIYIALFSAVGALAYILIRLMPRRIAQIISLGILLFLPVLCSFARVITYTSIQGSGGTYTFWEAVHRYFEKRR